MEKRYISTMLALLTVAAAANAYDLTVGASVHGTVTFSVGDAVTTTANEGDVVKINVAPESGWAVSDVSARIYTSWSSIKLKAAASPGVEKDIDVTGSGNEWTFTMKDGNADITVEYARIVQDAWIQSINAFTYSGLAIEPTVNVLDGDVALSFGTDYTIAYADNLNAGEATVTVTGIGNYCGEATAKFTINRAEITAITAPSAIENLIYTGEAQALVAAGSANGGEMQYSLDGETFTTSIPSATAAGNYVVYYRVVGDENHLDVAAQTVNVTINRAEITAITAPSAIENLIYTGEAQALVAAGSANGGEMQYSLDGETFTTDVPSATTAGNYVVSYRVVGDENHLDVAAQTVNVTINRAEITAITAPSAIENLIYTGEAQALVAAGSAIGGEMQYSLDGETFTTSIPSATAAGNYVVSYRVVGDENHLDVAAQTVNVTIAVNFAALESAISDATTYATSIANDYAEVATTLNGAIATAQAVLTKADATQSEVDDAANNLQTAVNQAKDDVSAIIAGLGSVACEASSGASYDLLGRKQSQAQGFGISNRKVIFLKK